MKKTVVTLLIIVAIMLSFLYRFPDDRLHLEKIEMADYSEADTIEINDKYNIKVVNFVKFKALGKYESIVTIIKYKPDGRFIAYKISNKKHGLRFSRDYIALTKEFGKLNHGWFYFHNGKLEKQLPSLKRMEDSLLLSFGKETFVNSANGYIIIKTKRSISFHDQLRQYNYPV